MNDTQYGIRTVERLAREQHGVATRAQIAEAGVTPSVLRRLLRSGQWAAHLGVIMVPATPRSPDATDAMALALRLGEQALVSGPTALRLQGFELHERMLVAWSPRTVSMPRVPDVRILRDSVVRHEKLVRGVRMVALSDALIDTLGLVSERRAGELLDTALQLRFLGPQEWFDAVTPRLAPGRALTTRLRTLTARIDEGTHSDSERKCASLMRKAGISGWSANWVLRNELGRAIATLDFAFTHLKLAIEIDGWVAHAGREQFAYDRERQNQLELLGWMVLRFTWHQLVNSPGWVLSQIQQAIDLRSRALAEGRL